MQRLISICLALLVSGCASTARFPDNPPLVRADAIGPVPVAHSGENDIVMLLSFSGGGSRASALAYGVLEALSTTPLAPAAEGSLLEEVDMITAVSGGSITAAYYGLYGERLFKDFKPRFLDADIESELKQTLLSPANLAKLSSPTYGSGDVLDTFFRTRLFGERPLSSLLDAEGPFIEINATDLFKGGRFAFNHEQFALICSDPGRFPVARAVAASSAVPLLFTPITLANRAGSCNFVPPSWLYQGLNEKDTNNRRYRRAKQYSTYLDQEQHPYIHLLDGGLADNLGLRAVIDRIVESGGIWKTLQRMRQEEATQIVILVVDASATPPSQWERSAETPSTGAILDAATTTPLANYNFETLEYLRSHIPLWRKEIAIQRCSGRPNCPHTEFYLIDIKLEDIADAATRNKLSHVPTGFTLEPGVSDQLISAAHELLQAHPEFQRLLLHQGL